MQVVCSQCQTPYELGPEYAGKKVRCRTCQAVIEVPAFGPAPETGTPGAEPDPYRSPAAGAGQYPYGVDRAAAFEVHRKLIGIFNIIAGVVSLLWGLFAAFVVVVGVIATHEMPRARRDEEFWIPVAIYGVMFLLSAITGIVQLVAGTKVLKGSPGARNTGLAAGFLGCVSLWEVCVYPMSLGVGIYTLIILFGRDARSFLETRGRLR